MSIIDETFYAALVTCVLKERVKVKTENFHLDLFLQI